jgi:hypothetical protein
MISESEIIHELNRLETLIMSRISSIKEMINDEDRWVAEEIALKKQSSNELSTKYHTQATPSMIRTYATTRNFGRCT